MSDHFIPTSRTELNIKHLGSFFTRLVKFYSVAEIPSDFANTHMENRVLQTEYFLKISVKPTIEKSTTFLEKDQNRVKKPSTYFSAI